MIIKNSDGSLSIDHPNYAGRVFKDQAAVDQEVLSCLSVLVAFTQAMADRLAPVAATSRPVKATVQAQALAA